MLFRSCRPFVIGRLGTVAQKLMKLFEDVSDGTCPASGWSWPSFSNPVAMTDWRRVNDDCASLPPLPPETALAEGWNKGCEMSDSADKA